MLKSWYLLTLFPVTSYEIKLLLNGVVPRVGDISIDILKELVLDNGYVRVTFGCVATSVGMTSTIVNGTEIGHRIASVNSWYYILFFNSW